MSKYQNRIVESLKLGAQLHCTEGVDYKTWLINPNGSTEPIRRDSAERICLDYQDKLVFSDLRYGIYWRGVNVKFN